MLGDGSSVCIKRQIEGQDIHSRLTQDTKLPAFRVLAYQRPHLLLRHVAG